LNQYYIMLSVFE